MIDAHTAHSIYFEVMAERWFYWFYSLHGLPSFFGEFIVEYKTKDQTFY